MSPDFALVREPARVELRALLAELAERIPVRVLLWAGSPLPLFRPDRKDVARTLHRLTSDTKPVKWPVTLEIMRWRIEKPTSAR